MPLTPETLARHELNGLPVRVVESDDPGREGIEGRVVSETAKTLSIEEFDDGDARVLTVPKSGSVFEFAITDDAAGDEKFPGTTCELADTQPDSGDESTESDRAGTGGDAASVSRADLDRHASENVAYVTVDGSRLLSRPARRTETRGDSPWQ